MHRLTCMPEKHAEPALQGTSIGKQCSPTYGLLCMDSIGDIVDALCSELSEEEQKKKARLERLAAWKKQQGLEQVKPQDNGASAAQPLAEPTVPGVSTSAPSKPVAKVWCEVDARLYLVSITPCLSRVAVLKGRVHMQDAVGGPSIGPGDCGS